MLDYHLAKGLNQPTMNAYYESGQTWEGLGLTWSDFIAGIRKAPMIRIRKNIGSRKFADRRDKLQQAYDGINGSAMITAPTNPTPADFLLKLDAIDAKMTEINDARTELAMLRQQRNQLFAEAEQFYAMWGSYVEIASGDDRAIAESSGFELVTDEPAPLPPLEKPGSVTASTGANDTEMDVSWDSDPTASAFEVQTSPDPINGSSWVHGATVAASQVTITGLPQMAKRWARVRGIRGGVAGPWSDPSCAVVT
jgi:hypothetical protein